MKHRAFDWIPADALPGDALTVVVAEDDYTFGILNSSLHVWWATRLGTSLGVGNDSRYTPTTSFETFPFPQPTEAQRLKIEEAARYLEQARSYLRGAGLGLTAMYNALATYRETGEEAITGTATLGDAHDMLDQAVAAAYSWEWPLAEEDVLARLLELNRERD